MRYPFKLTSEVLLGRWENLEVLQKFSTVWVPSTALIFRDSTVPWSNTKSTGATRTSRSLVLLTVCSADKRVTYAQVGTLGFLCDSTLLHWRSHLQIIQSVKWLNATILSLLVGEVDVCSFLLGNCAFRLTTFMMRSCNKPETSADPRLVW